jgi:hypothetical protein
MVLTIVFLLWWYGVFMEGLGVWTGIDYFHVAFV